MLYDVHSVFLPVNHLDFKIDHLGKSAYEEKKYLL